MDHQSSITASPQQINQGTGNTAEPNIERSYGPQYPKVHTRPYDYNNVGEAFSWKYENRRTFQEILPGVFLGPLSSTRDLPLLQSHSITSLLAIRTSQTAALLTPRPQQQQLFRCSYIDLGSAEDGHGCIKWFQVCKDMIDAELRRSGKVLVYDTDGNTHAAAFVCAYVMETLSLPFASAAQLVQQRRFSVVLDDAIKFQLREYEPLWEARRMIAGHEYTDTELFRTSRRRRVGRWESEEEKGQRESEEVGRVGEAPFRDAREEGGGVDMGNGAGDGDMEMEMEM
ncbi:hypothetical protein YB2330_001691 [Saitoella coloradoensis]